MRKLALALASFWLAMTLPTGGLAQEEYSMPDLNYEFGETMARELDHAFSLGADIDFQEFSIDATMRSLDFYLQEAVVQSIENWASEQGRTSVLDQNAIPTSVVIALANVGCKVTEYPSSFCSFIRSTPVAFLRLAIVLNIWGSDIRERAYLQRIGNRDGIDLSIEIFRQREDLDFLLNADFVEFQERARDFHIFRSRFPNCVGSLLDPLSAVTCPTAP